jgi:hypothetical protein
MINLLERRSAQAPLPAIVLLGETMRLYPERLLLASTAGLFHWPKCGKCEIK